MTQPTARCVRSTRFAPPTRSRPANKKHGVPLCLECFSGYEDPASVFLVVGRQRKGGERKVALAVALSCSVSVPRVGG